jgi:hypothetical protein
MIYKEKGGWSGLDTCPMTGRSGGLFDHSNDTSGTTTAGGFVKQLSDCKLRTHDSVPRSYHIVICQSVLFRNADGVLLLKPSSSVVLKVFSWRATICNLTHSMYHQ